MTDRIALFFDIDGTLFDEATKSVLPSTIKMLDELKSKGIYDLYLSTGRSLETLGKINEYKEYFTGMNLTNGQEIYINGKTYYGDMFDKEVLTRLLKASEERNNPLGLILKDDIIMNFITEESTYTFTTYIKATVTNLDHKPFDLSRDVMQVWLFAKNEDIEHYKEEFMDVLFLNWGHYGADVIPFGASKARGINHIKSIMGYKKENMYAFGDGDNDTFMFEAVGTSVAMGNGSKLAKAKATFITDDISEDGLYNAVKRLKLI